MKTLLQKGTYVFPEFLPQAAASFSTRAFEASRDLALFLETLGGGPERFCTVDQVHGDKVLFVSEPDPSGTPEADGLLTSEKDLALVIRTADCVPLFFLDPATPAVGMGHLGWRGAKKGIVFRILERFRSAFKSNPGSMKVALGPSICEGCYEVGEEFQDYFPGFVKKNGSQYFFNLGGAVKQQLFDSGIRPGGVFDSGFCTACSVDQFFSARREGIETGRFLSAILLKSGEFCR